MKTHMAESMGTDDRVDVESTDADGHRVESKGSDASSESADQEQPPGEVAGTSVGLWTEFSVEAKAALHQFIPKIPEIVDAYLASRKAHVQGSWAQARCETLARYVLSAAIVLVIAALGWNKVLSGEAVIGILAALVGYLWGKSRKEEDE